MGNNLTPEEQGLALAHQVFQERIEELKKLTDYMEAKGKLSHEYCIMDNWEELLTRLEKGEVIPYECWAVPKLSANLFI